MKVRAPRGQTTTSTSTSGQAPWIARPPQPHPLSVLLFGKRPPRLLDKRRFPSLKKALRKLENIKEQISEVLGVPDETFAVELSVGDNACISQDGEIRIGIELLEQHQQDDDFLVAVLGHEIGHQPWDWPEGDLSGLKKAQLDQLYREEEAKADRFAGRVLADLGASPDAICNLFLAHARFERHPPSDYYPARERSEMIREAFRRRKHALETGAKLNPLLAQRARQLR